MNPFIIIKYLIVGICVLIYVISPLYLIPDNLGLFGFLDDALSVVIFIIYIINYFYTDFYNNYNNIMEEIRAR